MEEQKYIKLRFWNEVVTRSIRTGASQICKVNDLFHLFFSFHELSVEPMTILWRPIFILFYAASVLSLSVRGTRQQLVYFGKLGHHYESGASSSVNLIIYFVLIAKFRLRYLRILLTEQICASILITWFYVSITTILHHLCPELPCFIPVIIFSVWTQNASD